MKRAAFARFLAAGLLLSLSAPAFAGGPLSVCSNVPTKYAGAGTVTLNYDGGSATLGSRTKAQADALVTESVSLWTNVATATVSLARGSDLPVDVNASNYSTYLSNFSDGLNPVIYDTDGSIIDTLYGSGAKSSILGFAGSAWYIYPTYCQYAEGRAVINGYIGVSDTTMKVVLAHEVGHLIGMDHTQLDSTQGLASASYPLMYPIAYRGYVSLHEDDAAAVSALYPDATLGSVYGQLTGTFTQVGGTPIRGANLWAKETTTNKLYSIVSDYLLQTTGYFKLLLPAGTYTLSAEAIQTNFTGGSSVGPYSEVYPTDLSFQPPLYVSGTPMTPVTLGNGTPVQIVITAGCAAIATFKFDGTGSVNAGDCGATVPTVVTNAASSVAAGSATLNGTVNPNGFATTAWFQWGTSIAYGSTTSSQSAGSGSSNVAVSANLSGLSPNTTYHYRVAANNSAGTSYGSDVSFTTSAATYTVGGTISGLTGDIVLANNDGDPLSLSANGNFTFATALANGAAYNVTIPISTSTRTCTVTNGSGTIAAANVTNVVVACTDTVVVTSVGVYSTLNPSLSGQSATFIASVTGIAPTGTINFKDGAASIGGCAAKPLSAGVATCATSALTLGDHNITASYSGDGNNPATASPVLVQSVNSADTTPNAFSFTDQTDVPLGSVITSAPVPIAGINATTGWTASGGTVCVSATGDCGFCPAGYTTSGTVANSQFLCAQHSSAGGFSTATDTLVTVGGVSDTFTSTTLADSGLTASKPVDLRVLESRTVRRNGEQ